MTPQPGSTRCRQSRRRQLEFFPHLQPCALPRESEHLPDPPRWRCTVPASTHADSSGWSRERRRALRLLARSFERRLWALVAAERLEAARMRRRERGPGPGEGTSDLWNRSGAGPRGAAVGARRAAEPTRFGNGAVPLTSAGTRDRTPTPAAAPRRWIPSPLPDLAASRNDLADTLRRAGKPPVPSFASHSASAGSRGAERPQNGRRSSTRGSA